MAARGNEGVEMSAVVPDTGGKPANGEALYEKLKPGPGLAAELVTANQRERIRGALVELVAKRGYGGVTVRELSRLAGVSTKTFYDCFANVEDCFAATYGRIVGDILRRSVEVSADGEEGFRARICAVFAGLGEDPKSARLVLLESLFAGELTRRKSCHVKRALEHLIREEFAAPPKPVRIERATAQGLVDAALHLARVALLAGRSADIPALGNAIADWLLKLRDQRLLRRGCMSPGIMPSAPANARGPVGMTGDRQLLIAAVGKLNMTTDYEDLSVTAIRRAAGLSRRSFHDNFEGVADCFLAAVEAHLSAAADAAAEEAIGAGDWERGTVRAIAALGATFGRDPALAQLGLVDILAPGRAGLELREHVISRWAERLRRTAPRNTRVRPLEAAASVATAWSMAAAATEAGRSAQILEEVPRMAFLVLAPAIGPARAEHAVLAELH